MSDHTHSDVLNVSTTGDAGDIFVMLATLKHTGKQCDVYLRDHPRTAGIVHRAYLVKPLVEAQPYINSVRIWKCEPLHWESEKFRHYRFVNNKLNLAHNHAQAALKDGFIAEMPDVSKPWLTVDPDTSYAGRVVVNRSPRYNNPRFPWKEVVKHFGERIIFIGLADEHSRFCASFGNVEYRTTRDFLEVAQMIAGSELFIGNQSACMTIAEGLKHPRIQEVCLTHPDCIYPGNAGAQYIYDGVVTLPDGTVLRGVRPKTEKKTHITPPGNWRYNGGASPCFGLLVREVAKRENITIGEAEDLVYDANVERCPDFFADYGEQAQFLRVQQALENYRL